MSNNLIQYAFTAGEVSPKYFGRSDLEKYDLGLSLAKNYFIDYRGGLSTRPGSRFIDYIQHDDKPTKLVQFRYAPEVSQTYVLLFGDGYIRFIQDGGYVLETGKAITGVTKANPGVVTAAAHGFSTGDWIKITDVGGMTELNGRTFEVGTVTTNTFQLKDPFGNNLNTTGYGTYTGGGEAARIYTVTSPYDVADLAKLKAHQRRNVVNLTHIDYEPRALERIGHTNWTLTTVDFSNEVAPPTNLTLSVFAGMGGAGGYTAAVTSVSEDGKESLPTKRVTASFIAGTGNDGFFIAGVIRWTWTAAADAAYYNLYRSPFVDRGMNPGVNLGYLAKVWGTSYDDQNSVPDFTKVPPVEYNPFANDSILFITITNGGSGYGLNDTTVSVGGPGSGFRGQPIVNHVTGAIEAVIILQGGKGYTAPTVSFSGTGTGATATAATTPSSGNYPALSSVFQQRQIYAASVNQPLTIWGSQISDYNNFSISDAVVESDGYEFILDTEDVTPIKHILPTRGGLLLMTQSGVYLLNGGGLDQAISSINALAEPQTYNGCSDVPPISIDIDILYLDNVGTTVRLLSYNDFSKVYGGVNMSILANHLFKDNNPIVEWSYAEAPHNLIFARRKDGAMLTFTLVKEQNVYAWTQNWTRGLYDNVLSIRETDIDTTYYTVKRYVNGRWSKFLEVFDARNFTDIEEAWCVDSGLALGHTYPAANISFSAATGMGVTVTASAAIFSAGDVNKVLRGGGGKAVVTGYTNSTTITVDFINDVTAVIPETDIPLEVASGDWTLDAQLTSVGGLWHLEGEELVGLADGNVVTGLTVTNGRVTLPHASSSVTVGLPYTCIARNLPPTARDTIIEHKVKDIVGVAVRVNDTRGLETGSRLDNLYEMKERTNEAWGEPIRVQDGVKSVLIESDWDKDGQTYFVQNHPLPATILGIVLDLEVGDDND